MQEIQTFTGGRVAGITAHLTVRPEEATNFDRKAKRKRTASIWALSLEVEGDDMRKLIANLTEDAVTISMSGCTPLSYQVNISGTRSDNESLTCS